MTETKTIEKSRRGAAATDAEARVIPSVVLLDLTEIIGDLYPALIRLLRDQHGTKFLILARDAANTAFFKQHCTDTDVPVDLAEIERKAVDEGKGHDAGEIMSAARANEERYSITYMRDIVQLDRRISTRFNPGATQSVHTDHDDGTLTEIFGQTNSYFADFERLLDEHGVDLVITRPDSRFGAALTYMAAQRKIPVTVPGASNFETFITWFCGPFMADDYLRDRTEALAEAPAPAQIEGSLVPGAAKRIAEQANKIATISHMLRQWYLLSKFRVGHVLLDIKLRKRRKRLGYVKIMWQQWRTYCAARYLIRVGKGKIEALGDRPFVLFLLQVEPEYSTLCLAREFGYTEAIVYQLALCMPAGVTLVLKEHAPNIGNRAIDFYRRLGKLPNVVFADYRLPGNELAEKARAVATVSGSIGKQSTRLGKPALIFSSHVDYAFMPNVKVITSFYDLPEAVRWAVKERSEEEIAEWKKAGVRFYQALRSASFDAPGTRLFGGTVPNLPEGEAARALDILIDVYNWQLEHGFRF